ncbi:MAG: hypothetical protein ABFS34_06530 [Gemmatimonadota bacterium]
MNPTLKNIVAAVFGYLVMVVVVFVAFTIVWQILGPDGAFEPGSWDVSGAWIAASIVLGLVAAVAGGWSCARMAPNQNALYILIALIVVLGVLSALPEAGLALGPRPEDVSMFEAMGSVAQPRWVAWLNPVIGVIGAVFGARLAGRKASA